ncbi:histone deacetylase family protein [Reyranella sp. CPCC 100927]|uniref:histone deacetylase family protein n=1 Tax=Reyranella sp. CPCC 100927 TaxID=2599616 RepID=UPI0011B83A42|nr:histone deacetylase family protein [Reyranella sp. CPCC 100927]TWT05663.1 histone deacetylase family protein [Reyranella sp. CPCC 100927]
MATLLYTHPACLAHDTGPGHPERPARLQAVLAALDDPEFAALQRREAPLASTEDLMLAHPARHVQAVMSAIPQDGLSMLDGDTLVSPGSREAALRAAGAVVAAVDAVVGGAASNAFCAVRPPGHHAEPDRAMGFCLFNNVVVGARRAQQAHGLSRIAIVDFDVHHGNGTETQALADQRLFYASTHQSPLYPGTGMGNDPGHPNVINVPLPPRAGSPEFRAAMIDGVLPALRAFKPELVIISAGFDAHRDDPLAELRLTEADYAWATEELLAVARDCAGGRLVSALEGGYNLEALARSAAAHVRALMAA